MKTFLLASLLTCANCIKAQADQWFVYQTPKRINCLMSDCNTVWAGLTSGIVAYNPETKGSILYNWANSGIMGEVNKIAVDQDGNKWVGTSKGLFEVTQSDFSSINLNGLAPDIGMSITDVAVDFNNDIWLIVNKKYIYKFDRITNFCTEELTDESNYNFRLQADENGNIYFICNSSPGLSIFVFDGSFHESGKLETIPFDNKLVQSFTIDKSGVIWIGIGVEVVYGKDDDDYIFLNGGLIVYYGNQFYPFNSFELTNIEIGGFENLFSDNNGNIIMQESVGFTINTGLIATLQMHFDPYLLLPEVEKLELDTTVNKLLWVDADNKEYFYGSNNILINTNETDSISIGNIPSFYQPRITMDHENNIWIVGYSKLRKITPTEVYIFDDVMEDEYPGSIYTNQKDHIWINQSTYMYEFDGTAWIYHSAASLISPFDSPYIIDYKQDIQMNDWYLLSESLIKSDSSGKQEILIPLDSDDYAKKLYTFDSAVFVVSDKNCFEYSNGTWKKYNSSNSALPDYLEGIRMVNDKNGNLYIGTFDGLFMLSDDSIYKLYDYIVRGLQFNLAENSLWVFANSGWMKYVSPGVFITYEIPSPESTNFYASAIDTSGNLIFIGDMGDNDLIIFNELGLAGYSNLVDLPESVPPSACRKASSFNNGIQVFPNPSSDLIVMNFTVESTGDYNYSIYDIAGKIVIQKELGDIEPGIRNITIPVANLPSGLYVINLADTNHQQTAKFIKN